MKIRQKIALWITGAGVLVSLVSSIIVFLAMIEEPYRLIDEELNTVAHAVIPFASAAGESPEGIKSSKLPINFKAYWIKVYNDHKTVVYQSELTRHADLSLYDKHSLENSLESQKQFLASASHELKSPLALLQLSMEDCLQRRDLPDSLRHQLIRQTDIQRRMSRLVKNLLDLSALELKERLDLKAMNLSELLTSVLSDYEVVFSAKKIDVQADIPPKLIINGDWDNLQRAIINLVDNAVKYNHKGGKIKIAVTAKNKGVHMSLFNTGRGIPAEDLDRVFEQFYRVEKSRSAEYGGSGLGLSIVKRIIALHGGRIDIESEPSSGTRVNVLLP